MKSFPIVFSSLLFAISATINFTTLAPVQSSTEFVKRENPEIRFVTSQPCSLICFLDAIAQRPHTTKWLRGWYEQARQKQTQAENDLLKDDDDVLKDYQSLLNQQSSAYNFSDPTGRQLDLRQKLIYEAASCQTVEQFLDRCAKFMKTKDLEKLTKIINYFEMPYFDLVWDPSQPALQRQLKEFQDKSIECKLNEKLSQVQVFLNAPWVEKLPFTVVLSPLPVDQKGTHGESLGAVQVVELLPKHTFKSQADVVFHEAVHSLWFSKKDEEAVRNLFVYPGKGQLPMTELYEGMATALGQGWFAKEAFGKTLKSWYADETINRYAHLVYPVYSDYLRQGKALDADFAEKTTRIYFEKMPQDISTIKQTDSIIVVADDFSDFSTFKSKLERALPRLRESQISSPMNAKETIESFRKSSVERGIVMCSVTHVDQLEALGFSGEQIQKLKTRNNSQPVTLLVGSKKITVCIADSADQREGKALSLLAQKQWPSLKASE
jgi:hypothetical protein